jgi:ComF family protein
MQAMTNILRPLLDFALPPRCAGCSMIVANPDQLCVECWSSIRFLTDVGCGLCGSPTVSAHLICAPCLKQRPSHNGVKSAAVYEGAARDIVLRFKHGRRTGLATLMAKAMARHVDPRAALLIPVPLHRWRLWSRGYNQSLVLANVLRDHCSVPVRHDILARVKATPPLGGLGAAGRAKAMIGVFKVPAPHRSILRDAHVTLVDDVYTSGATANACALALKRAGTARVDVVSWARVLRENETSN